MKTVYSIAAKAAGVMVLCGGCLWASSYFADTEVYQTASLAQANNALNEKGNMWQMINKPVNGLKTVTDGTGTVFKNIPASMTDKDIIKHFEQRPEWKNHNFYPDKYVVHIFNDDGKPVPNNDFGCMTWTEYATLNKLSQWDLTKERNDFIKACGWNDSVNMDIDVPFWGKWMIDFERRTDMLAPWVFGIGFLCCIPALWVGFWRLLGVAFRSAKKSMKGE